MITEPCPPPDFAEDETSAEPRPVALLERIEYVSAVAALFGFDRVATRQDAARLRRLCRELDLPDPEVERLLARLSPGGRR